MNKYESALRQMCLHCKTKPSNCHKKKCNRYNALKELVEKEVNKDADKRKN